MRSVSVMAPKRPSTWPDVLQVVEPVWAEQRQLALAAYERDV